MVGAMMITICANYNIDYFLNQLAYITTISNIILLLARLTYYLAIYQSYTIYHQQTNSIIIK